MEPSFTVVTEDVEVKTVEKKVVGAQITLTKEQIFLIRDLLGGTSFADKRRIIQESINYSDIGADANVDSADGQRLLGIAGPVSELFDKIAIEIKYPKSEDDNA
jgi:hypothetical protein